MKLEELQKAKAPFDVRYQGKGKLITVTGFTENDPLGVGGGLFPNMPVCRFKNGGWLLVNDLLKHYELASKRRKP